MAKFLIILIVGALVSGGISYRHERYPRLDRDDESDEPAPRWKERVEPLDDELGEYLFKMQKDNDPQWIRGPLHDKFRHGPKKDTHDHHGHCKLTDVANELKALKPDASLWAEVDHIWQHYAKECTPANPTTDPKGRCPLTKGDGVGKSEILVDASDEKSCVVACMEKKKTNEKINGVTMLPASLKGKFRCWCEVEMEEQRPYKSCRFDDDGGCTLVEGDGHGTSETEVTGLTDVKGCLAACKEKDGVNGITVIPGEKFRCWCEKGLTSIRPYKSCFLKKVLGAKECDQCYLKKLEKKVAEAGNNLEAKFNAINSVRAEWDGECQKKMSATCEL